MRRCVGIRCRACRRGRVRNVLGRPRCRGAATIRCHEQPAADGNQGRHQQQGDIVPGTLFGTGNALPARACGTLEARIAKGIVLTWRNSVVGSLIHLVSPMFLLGERAFCGLCSRRNAQAEGRASLRLRFRRGGRCARRATPRLADAHARRQGRHRHAAGAPSPRPGERCGRLNAQCRWACGPEDGDRTQRITHLPRQTRSGASRALPCGRRSGSR